MSVNPQKRNRNYVYTFISIAVASFLFMTLMILLNNNTFEKKVVLHTKISNALGIETHPSIIFRGFEIGKVVDFKFDENLDVIVDFFVYEKYSSLISKKSVLHPIRNPLTGIIIDLYIFSSFQGDRGLENGTVLVSTESGRGKVIAENYNILIKEPGVNEVVRRIDVLLKEIEDQNIISNLGFVAQRLKDTVNEIEGEIIKLKDEGGVEEIKYNISAVSKQVNDLVNNLNGLISEVDLRGRSISSTIEKAENVLDNADYLLEGISQNDFVHKKMSPAKYRGEKGIKFND